MDVSNVELYEVIKGHVGEEGARMIAAVVPPAKELATKLDLANVRLEISQLRAEMREELAEVRGEIHASANSTIKWILGVSVPMWAGTWGVVIAILLRT